MAFEQRSLDDYVDVATRIAEFRQQYPEGSLQPADPAKPWEQAIVTGVDKHGQPFAMTMIVYVAAAYRTPDDPRPGVGVAWEPFPGRTPFTLGSELMNAETSAWGRAIAALGIATKQGIASRQEVEHRDAERLIDEARAMRRLPPEVDANGAATVAEQTRMITGPEPGTVRGPLPASEDPWLDGPAGLAPQDLPEDRHGTATADQIKALQAAFATKGIGRDAVGAAAIRDAKIKWLVDKFGPDIHSSKDLSYTQAARALQELR